MLKPDMLTTLLEKTDYMRSKIRGCSDLSFTWDVVKDTITIRCTYYTGEMFQKDFSIEQFLCFDRDDLDRVIKEYF